MLVTEMVDRDSMGDTTEGTDELIAGAGVVTGTWDAWDGSVSLKKSGWVEEMDVRLECSSECSSECSAMGRGQGQDTKDGADTATDDVSPNAVAIVGAAASANVNAADLADSVTFSHYANKWGAVCYELVASCSTPISMPAQLDSYPCLRSLSDVISVAGQEEMWIEDLWFNFSNPCAILYHVFHKILREVMNGTTERRKLNLYRYFIETKDMKAGAGQELVANQEEEGSGESHAEGGSEGEGGGEGNENDMEESMTSVEIVALRDFGHAVDTGRGNLLEYCMSDKHGGKHHDGVILQSTVQALDEGYAFDREKEKMENKYGSPKKAKNKKKATLIKQSCGVYGTEEKKIGKRTFTVVKPANQYFEDFAQSMVPYARSDGSYNKKPEDKKKKKNIWDQHEDEFPPIEMYHHRVSMVHGQLTSANIVLDPCGNVWLLGFGFWESGGWGGFGMRGDDGVTNGTTKQPILVDIARLFCDICFKQTKLESTIELSTVTKIISNIIASDDLRFAAKEAKARYEGKDKKEEKPHAFEPHTHEPEDVPHEHEDEHHDDEHHEEEHQADELTLADRLVGETKFEMLHTMLLHLLQYAGSYVSEGSDHRGDCDWHMLNLLFPLMRFSIMVASEATRAGEAAALAIQKKAAAAEAAEMARNAYDEAMSIIVYMNQEVPLMLQEAEARAVAEQLANAALAEDPDAVLPPLPKVRDVSIPERKKQRMTKLIAVIPTCLQRRWAMAAAAQCAGRIHGIFDKARLVHEEAVEKLNGDELTKRQRREQERLFVSCWGDAYMDVPAAQKKAQAAEAAEAAAAEKEARDEDEDEDEDEDDEESEEEEESADEEDDSSPMLKNMLLPASEEALLLDKARYGLQVRSECTWIHDPMSRRKLDIGQQYVHLRLVKDHDDPKLYDEKGRRHSKGKLESDSAGAKDNTAGGSSNNNEQWTLQGDEVDLPDVFMFVMQQCNERLPVGHRVMLKCHDWEPPPPDPKSDEEEEEEEVEGLEEIEELKVGGIPEEETAEDIADDDVSGKEDGPKGEDLVLLMQLKKDLRAGIKAFRPTVWEAFQAYDVEGKGSLNLKDYRGAILMMDLAMPDGKTLEFLQNDVGKNHNQETEFEHLRRFMLMQAIITSVDISGEAKFDLKPHPCELRPKSRRLFGEGMVWKDVPRDWVLPRPLLLLGEAGAGKTMAIRQMLSLWSTEIDTSASTWSDVLMLVVPVREVMIAMRVHDEKLLKAKAKAAEEGEDLDANEGFKAGSISRKPRNPEKLMAAGGADILNIFIDDKFGVGTTRWALMKRMRSLKKLVVIFEGMEAAHYPIIDDEMFPAPDAPPHIQPDPDETLERKESVIHHHLAHGGARKQSRVKVNVRKQIKPWHYAGAIAIFLNNFLCEELMVVATSTDGGVDLSKFDWFLKARIVPFNEQQVDFVATQRISAPDLAMDEEEEWGEEGEDYDESGYPQAVATIDDGGESNQLNADGSRSGCVKEGEALLSAFRELVYKFEEFPNDMYDLNGAIDAAATRGRAGGGGGGGGGGVAYGMEPEDDELYDDEEDEVNSEIGDYGFTATADYGFSSTFAQTGGDEAGVPIPRRPRLPQVRSYMQDLFTTLCKSPLMLNGMLTALTQLGAWNAQQAVEMTHANYAHVDPKHTIKAAGSMERNQFFSAFVYQSLRSYIRAHDGFTVLNLHNGIKEETDVGVEQDQVGLLTKLLQVMAFTAQKRKKTGLSIREVDQLLRIPDPEDDSESEDEDDGATDKPPLFDEVDALHALSEEDAAPLRLVWQWLLHHLVRSDNMMPLLTCQPFDKEVNYNEQARDDDEEDDAPVNRMPTLEEEEENAWYHSFSQFRRRCTIRFAHLSIQHYLAARSMTTAMLKFCYQKEGGYLMETAAMRSTVNIGDPNGVDGGFRYCSAASLEYFEVPPYTHLIHLYVPMLAAGKGGEGGEPVQMFADDWWERVLQFVYEGSQVGLRALEVSKPLADAHTQHAPRATKEELLAAQFAAEAAAALALADEEAEALGGGTTLVATGGPKEMRPCKECISSTSSRAVTYARRRASVKMRSNTKSQAEKAGGGGGGGGSIPWEAAQETFVRPLPLRLLNDLSVDILKQNYQTGKLCVQNVELNQRQMKTLGLLLLCHKQLRTLEVENPNLSPRSVLLLARACCHHQLLRKLTVTPYGVALPVQVLKGSSGVPVRKLDLAGKGVGFKDVLALGTLLAHNGVLRSLDLTDATVNNTKMVDGRVQGEYIEDGAVALAGALKGPCSCLLRRLELGGCGLGLVSLSSFALLCRALRGNKILRALGLQRNCLPARAGIMLGGLLRANDALHELNIAENQLVEYWNAEDLAADQAADVYGRRFGGGAEALVAFGGGPAKSLTSLTEKKTGPTVKEAELVESRSMGFLPKNRYLPAGDADEEEVAAAMNTPAARAARATVKGALDTVEDLHGITDFASGLRDNRTLRKLDISDNCLGVAGIKVLAHYLTIPEGTPVIRVEPTGEAAIGADGIELEGSVVLAVGDAAVYTGVMEELNCSLNDICGLFKFKEKGEVKEIGFYDPAGVIALVQAVSSQKAVVTLNIADNSVRAKDKRQIRGLLGCQARPGDVDLKI
jgi:hypothetical protein